jgi:hypothetical protein
MWIIPKTLSAFVPDTEGLNLDLEERAWILDASAMWRSKPSSKPTWLRRLKKGGWITHLSTRILKPSLHESFEEKYTASLEDIHVSPSVAQGSEKEKKTQDTYGPTSDSTSGQLDLFGAFSKMSEVTPRWGYGESCPIWKKMVTERSGDCSVRRKQARLTNASESSSWPTPRAGNPGSRKPGTGGKILAEEAKKSWATPQSRDHKSAEPKEKWEARAKLQAEKGVNLHLPLNTQCQHIMEEEAKKNWRTPSVAEVQNQCNSTQIYLQNQVGATEKKGKNWDKHNGPPAQEKSSTSGKNQGSWPTARSSDAEGGRIKTEKTEKGFRSKREKSDQYFGAKLRDAAEMEKPPSMKLNPNWVEQLMGLEVGWTQLPTEWIDSDS